MQTDASSYLKDYSFYKMLAIKNYASKNYDIVLNIIKICCNIAYTFNFKFCDQDFENMIANIANDAVPPTLCGKGEKLRNVVFYDCFALPNRGLTEQYLHAILNVINDVNVLMIVFAKTDNTSVIKERFKKYNNLSIIYIKDDAREVDLLSKAKHIIDVVQNFHPSKAFLHMAPDDVVGNVVWNAFPNVERYQINLTDHAFWLGVYCADYFLEFRNYGYNLSWQRRFISKDKLLILPYYPISQSAPFKGLPKTDDRKLVRLFSGGSVYKTYGRNGKFLEIVKDILDRNPQTIFYFAGSGNMKPMHGFIKKHRLESRWILLGNRTDIVPVVQHMDICIGTYPMSGGLMTQIFAMAKKPYISYVDADLNFTDLSDLFNEGSRPKISYSDLRSFHNAVDELITDSNLRNKIGEELYEVLPTRKQFENEFVSLINRKANIHSTCDIEINDKAIIDYYVETENIQHIYSRININKIAFKYNVVLFLKSVANYLYFKDKKMLFVKLYKKLIS